MKQDTLLQSTQRLVAKSRPLSDLNIRDVDADLKAQFKAECARRGVTMHSVIVAIMTEAVRDPSGTGMEKGFSLSRLIRTHPNIK